MKQNEIGALRGSWPAPLTQLIVGGLLRHAELSAAHVTDLARGLGLDAAALERAFDDLHDRGFICAAPPRSGPVFIGTLRLTLLDQATRVRAMAAHARAVGEVRHA